MIKKRSNIIFCLAVLFGASLLWVSCSTSPGINDGLNLSGEFSYQALEGYRIFELQSHESELFAGTSNGLVQFERSFPLQVSDAYLNNGEVRTFLILEDNYWLASIRFENSDSTNLYRSTNKGEAWHTYNNGFGGENKWVPSTMDFTRSDPLIIYARPYASNVAKSTDLGASWESVHHTWENPYLETSMFVKVDRNNQNIVWAGGATALFYPQLIRSKDDGETWEYVRLFEDFIETTVYDVAIHHQTSNRIMTGLGIGVRRSTDDSETWKSIFNEAAIFTFTHSARNPEVVYASGINQNGTLFFTASNNFGDSWEIVEFESGSTQIWVNDMISVLQNGKEVLYFGTNQGLYSYTFEN